MVHQIKSLVIMSPNHKLRGSRSSLCCSAQCLDASNAFNPVPIPIQVPVPVPFPVLPAPRRNMPYYRRPRHS